MKIYLWAVAAAFFWEQNKYFGWNGLPQSEGELICDGINLILISIAIFASIYTPLEPTQIKD